MRIEKLAVLAPMMIYSTWTFGQDAAASPVSCPGAISGLPDAIPIDDLESPFSALTAAIKASGCKSLGTISRGMIGR